MCNPTMGRGGHGVSCSLCCVKYKLSCWCMELKDANTNQLFARTLKISALTSSTFRLSYQSCCFILNFIMYIFFQEPRL